MEKFEILLYSVPEGKVSIEVIFEQETFWLSQKKMAELFNVSIPTINEHLQNIFTTNELEKESVIRKFLITAADGKNYNTQFYHLDAIIAVGYRVNSKEATRFRIWATKTLSEFIRKGFLLDDERLKLHWAVTGQTAAEIIYERVDAVKPNMGLTTWKNAPDGKILKTDVSIAKNYLAENEIDELNRVVTMYLDYAENQAKRNIAMSMADWAQRLDAFLQFNDYKTLDNAGNVSHEIAKKLAEDQYEQYRILQDKLFESDFDKLAKKLPTSHTPKKRSE